MTVKECYEMMGEDPEEVISRLMSEDRVAKYLHKFAEANDVEKLELALGEKTGKQLSEAPIISKD